MKQMQRTVTNHDAEWTTNRMKDWGEDSIVKALKWSTDSEKVQRKKERNCKTCYYLNRGRIGGASVTQWPCGICGVICSNGSTNTDRLCNDCSDNHQLCTYCGGDIELRVRRRFDLPEPNKVVLCDYCEHSYKREDLTNKDGHLLCLRCVDNV